MDDWVNVQPNESLVFPRVGHFATITTAINFGMRAATPPTLVAFEKRFNLLNP